MIPSKPFLLFAVCLFAESGNPLKDSRDGREYATVLVNGHAWMAEDLQYPTQGAWKKPGTLYCGQTSSNFYPHHERDSLCPEGWHLLRLAEWQTLFLSIYDTSYYELISWNGEHGYAYQYKLKNEEANFFDDLGALNISPTGWVQGERLRNRKAHHYWIDNEITHDPTHHVHIGPNGYVSHAHDFNIVDEKPSKTRRFAVRCVCDSSSTR